MPLLATAARAAPRHVFAAALAYAVTVLAVDVAPWLLPTLERYFRFDPAAARAVGTIAVVVTGVLYGALLGGALVLRRRTGRPLGILWCAALWSVWEPLRTALLPPHFPLSFLGTSQAAVLPMLQVASVTGIAGVTALVVAANAALAQALLPASGRHRLAGACAVAVVVLAAALWGGQRVARMSASPPEGPRIVLVDGAAAAAGESTLERYLAATGSAAVGRAALVVWPESALTLDLVQDAAAWRRLGAFVDELGVPLAAGGLGSAVTDGGRVAHFNSVHFMRPRHGMLSYHKRLLVPFAEAWPAALGAPPPAIEPVAAGRALGVFGANGLRFGALICFEITDAASVRALVGAGARLIVNVNNDVWFGTGVAPQLVWARVRAVESGVPVARATNGGTSAVIDPAGRAVAAARAAGRPAVLASAIPEPVDTLYVRTGEVFLPACLLVVLAGLRPARSRRVTAPPGTGG